MISIILKKKKIATFRVKGLQFLSEQREMWLLRWSQLINKDVKQRSMDIQEMSCQEREGPVQRP